MEFKDYCLVMGVEKARRLKTSSVPTANWREGISRTSLCGRHYGCNRIRNQVHFHQNSKHIKWASAFTSYH